MKSLYVLIMLLSSYATANVTEIVNATIDGDRPISLTCRMVSRCSSHTVCNDVPEIFATPPLDTTNNEYVSAILKSGTCSDYTEALNVTPVKMKGRKIIRQHNFLDTQNSICKHYFNDSAELEITNIPELAGVKFSGNTSFVVGPLSMSECQ